MNEIEENKPDKLEKAVMAGSCVVVGLMACGWLALALLVVMALIKFVFGV